MAAAPAVPLMTSLCKIRSLLAAVLSLVLASPAAAAGPRRPPAETSQRMAPAPARGAPGDFAPPAAPDLLSFDELLELSRTAEPDGALGERLAALLATPFLQNAARSAGAAPRRPWHDSLGEFLRVAMWNIERGYEFDWIRLAFSDPEEFLLRAESEFAGVSDEVRAQAYALALTDVIVLNEADLGMTRTGYRDVARELAEALGMNYAFGVEFVEVDPVNLGTETLEVPDDPEAEAVLRRAFAPDRARYRGLHGNAVLSRYPIRRARIVPLPVCHDWYRDEQAGVPPLERGRRWAGERVFLSRLERELRHGGRMALVTELAVEQLPAGALTVVAVHLESKATPDCRRRQLRAVLEAIREIEGPLVLAGDFNTLGADGSPVTVARELRKRVRSPAFWAERALVWFTPVSLPYMIRWPSNYFRSYRDPTRVHIPILASNHEAGLFGDLYRFRFADGNTFDFRGSAERSANGRGRTLANSNERARKGFRATFSFDRDLRGLAGSFKLDWILVKPLGLGHPRDDGAAYRFAPHFGRTLEELNRAVPGRISDHCPVTVDLPFDEPRLSRN
jgi:endonuclease/exonuclease/phosphatase family metal-dependent hydrolase